MLIKIKIFNFNNHVIINYVDYRIKKKYNFCFPHQIFIVNNY